MATSQHAMDESFLMTNVSPQVGVGFNRGYWARLEGFVRHLTRHFDDVYVVTGPLFLPTVRPVCSPHSLAPSLTVQHTSTTTHVAK